MKRLFSVVLLIAMASPLARADLKIAEEIPNPPAIPAGAHQSLPQRLEFQKQLRAFMATLKESDFTVAYKPLTALPLAEGPVTDEQFQTWILSLSPPSVGYKRNYSSVRIHPALFTLHVIENEPAILRPPAHPEALVDLADWNYPGNSYRDSRPLRLRAFALCALDMIMLEELLETGAPNAKPNQDQLCGAIARSAYVYPGVQSVIPADVQSAYLAGLKLLVRRALDHGPKVLPRTLGFFTVSIPALALSAKIINDPVITKDVEEYAKKIFTDPRFFSQAGYFPFGGTLDSFNGISLHFAMWGVSYSQWPFAREAIAKAYRLRAHLTLPEPDGLRIGPSHMGGLTPSDVPRDQWNTPLRAWGAALLTDEAACLTSMPSEEEIRKGDFAVVANVNGGLRELSWAEHGLDPKPWSVLPGIVPNYGYRGYPKDYYARRVALEKTSLAKLPVLRDENFVTRFSDEFLVAKTATHAVVVHTGPITDTSDPGAGFGFGGGAISAFWTRATGSVILGRGVGAWSPAYQKIFETWRSLPTHAVSGATASGNIFTSAHIAKPESTFETKDQTFSVTAHGLIPSTRKTQQLFEGSLDYRRKFDSTSQGVHVTTTIKSESVEPITELYETIPIFLTDANQPNAQTTIEFQVAGQWVPADELLVEKVTAARIRRFEGAVQVTFDKPVRAKLAPIWADQKYMVNVTCRNILIDLLDGATTPAALQGSRTVAYKIEPVAK